MCQHIFKESKPEASSIYPLMLHLWLCVSMCVFNVHAEERGRGWRLDEGWQPPFSFCPSHFAPLILALAEALNEHPKPVSGTCQKGEQETDLVLTMTPSVSHLFRQHNCRLQDLDTESWIVYQHLRTSKPNIISLVSKGRRYTAEREMYHPLQHTQKTHRG